LKIPERVLSGIRHSCIMLTDAQNAAYIYEMTENFNILCKLKEAFDMKEVDIKTYSPLSLAFMGDSVYDLIIRSMVVGRGNTSNNNLHKASVKYVSAVSQAKIIDTIMPELTEEEISIYKRGKNAKPHSGAKNATKGEYLKATGFEALVGYLYLKGDMDRILELVVKGIENE